jgi:hypothetical protein
MTHQPWCTSHLTDSECDIDVCLGPEIHLHFGDRGTHAVACSHVATDLSQARDNDHPSIMLHIDSEPVADLDKHQAAATAWGLLSQVAQLDGDPDMADYYRSLADEHAAAATVRSAP